MSVQQHKYAFGAIEASLWLESKTICFDYPALDAFPPFPHFSQL